MKTSKNFRLAVVTMACVGMLSPVAAFGAPPTTSQTQKAAPVRDAKLSGDALTGKVVDAQGNSIANSPVAVFSKGKVVAQAKTDAQGQFSIANIKGGVYQISSLGQTNNYRVWTAAAAPPAATDSLLMVASETVMRGQCASGGCANGHGGGGVVYGNPGGQVVYGGAGAGAGYGDGQVVYGDGGGAVYGDTGGQVVYGDGGGAVYGDAGGQVVYGDGGGAVYGGDVCAPAAGGGYPVDAGYGFAGAGAGGGGFGGGGFLGFLSSPLVIGAGVAAAIAIPLALDDDDDGDAAGNGGGAGDDGGGAAS